MKELYIAPELNVICFAPVERLATDLDIEHGDLLPDIGKSPEASTNRDDIDLDL